MDIPETAPEPSPVKLVTMTVVFKLKKFINLKLVSECIKLDDQILGVKFEDTIEGTGFKAKKQPVKKKHKKNNDFKNQCTLIINTGNKNLNVKLFNNGELVFTGCTDIDQIPIATKILTERLVKLDSYLEYDIPENFKFYTTRDIFKKEIAKYRELIHLIAYKLDFDINAEPFNPALSTKEAYTLFTETHEWIDQEEVDNILALLQLIRIIRSYYDDATILSWKSTDDFPKFVNNLLIMLDMETGKISGVFPSYLGNEKIIDADYSEIGISNILKRMSCNFPLNRENVYELLKNSPVIQRCEFDEDRYPGVVATLKTDTKLVTIIFFNSGKINITAATSDLQVDNAFEFIRNFCADNFHEIVMETDYKNKTLKQQDNMPDQFDLGEHEGVKYILLKKENILKNPRNVLLLKKFGLIQNYEKIST